MDFVSGDQFTSRNENNRKILLSAPVGASLLARKAETKMKIQLRVYLSRRNPIGIKRRKPFGHIESVRVEWEVVLGGGKEAESQRPIPSS